ncbi:LacI family DNA-binding transcriptional regulator [Jeotgalibacillus haloalkalitolerans]|uniref:LacI family DNA-binding transcriptional regulator n=1 Tax=Jeotgalibacillus haloalkalitolerans TaxID=3104292 RepID=A0ABU5KHN7_9BACL|nr:LacI family DNA-binding transcriptional regulator [Jeotgalibacillus sp. HH7-29]MDZ5710754.1 LacI family DNA-binding transcriptional regulator [Jeotgalibacillus sp. HH7-29]
MATIKQVAQHAGVSVATVSRVLNDKGYVHEDTRKAVLKAIEELQYNPNSVARSLFKKSSNTIGLLIPDITNPFFPQLVRAVEDVMYPKGYTTILFNSDENIQHELDYLKGMTSKYIDGVIVVSNTLKWEHLEPLTVPVIALDRHIDDRIASVTIDNYESSFKALEFLVERGCRKIAHLAGPAHVFTSSERLRAYKDFTQKHGLEEMIQEGSYELQSGMLNTMQLLTKYQQVDAIFAGNDVMAIGALKAAAKLGISVPKELSVMGFDGVEWGTAVTPELTTMQQPIYQIGQKAAEMLLKRLETPGLSPEHVRLNAELTVRQSTK